MQSLILCVVVASTLFITQNMPVQGKEEPVQKVAVSQQQPLSPCRNRVNVPDADMHWLYVPERASDLSSNVPYFFLSGQLIQSGAVDASACPAGGLGADGFANACGLAVAKPYTDQLQNTFDEAILDAWQTTGVPPLMLKQLIRHESQFWPTKWGKYHYGFGHLTYNGAVTGLNWYLPLRDEICTQSGGCSGADSFFLPNTLLSLMDASCPNCPLKIDVEKAKKSIHYLAEILMGYCYQTSQVVFNANKIPSYYLVDYATIWKLSLLNYNAGTVCTYNMVQEAYDFHRRALNWNDIRYFASDKLCQRGVAYVDLITEKFYDFPPGSQ
jgi:hypothetical protein